ncbi:MAG: septum formation initiator family protein [Candidatus Woesebacteria bacterium]|nr:MAG: septum formation initiator family protein [Candidatus Woesebacteria bacterium]
MKKDFVKRLKVKFEKLGGYAIWVLVVLLTLSLVQNIGKVKRIRGEIAAEKAKIAKMKAANEVLANQVAEAQKPEFIDKEIRNKLGLVKTGETIVVLPDGDVLRSLAPKIEIDLETLPDPNWKKWVQLFVSK